MLNYLTAEIFRAKKSITIIILLIAGILIPAYLAVNYGISYNDFSPELLEGIHYLEELMALMPASGFIIGLVATLFVYKDNDYYRIALSLGQSRISIILSDLMTINIITTAFALISLMSVLIMGMIFGNILQYDYIIGREALIQLFQRVLLIQFAINNSLLGVTYLINNKTSSLSTMIIVSIFSVAVKDMIPQGLNIIFQILMPYYPYLTGKIEPGMNIRFLIYFLLNTITYITIAYLGFRKREY